MYPEVGSRPVAPRPDVGLAEFVLRIPGAVSTELSARILEAFDHDDLYAPSGIATRKLAPNVRRSEQLDIPRTALRSGTASARGASRRLANAMHEWMARYCEHTGHAVELTRFSAPNLVRYRPGAFYDRHIDVVAGAERTVSAIALLHSSFTGGELRFFDERPCRIDGGDVVLFPSTFLFPHSVTPVRSGVRYTLVSWMR